ncbi:hypothetical protein [Peribacillus asahii]|uniref:hypothetical protein n=1 Tax=Peribacillus asahii TaxID=228899 RepID=UPI0037F3176A
MDKFEKICHVPDLKFTQFCEQHFSLNKGIYNTIDLWFYNRGLTNILSRRKVMLRFMTFSCTDEAKVKFGPGGLTRKLEDFWYQANEVLQEN